jgi:hypothetical protein
MTLLQTRVADEVASQFKQAAEKRKMSPYQLLSELVKQAASDTPPGWREHWASRIRIGGSTNENAVIKTREGEDR